MGSWTWIKDAREKIQIPFSVRIHIQWRDKYYLEIDVGLYLSLPFYLAIIARRIFARLASLDTFGTFGANIVEVSELVRSTFGVNGDTGEE